MFAKCGLKFSTVLLNCHNDLILHCHGLHCVLASFGAQLGEDLSQENSQDSGVLGNLKALLLVLNS